jgi:hypothetical protein
VFRRAETDEIGARALWRKPLVQLREHKQNVRESVKFVLLSTGAKTLDIRRPQENIVRT